MEYAFLILFGLVLDNKEFFEQVRKERDLGYKWEKIERTPAGTYQYEIPAVNEDGSKWILFEHKAPKK